MVEVKEEEVFGDFRVFGVGSKLRRCGTSIRLILLVTVGSVV